jgi:hypothetical protein
MASAEVWSCVELDTKAHLLKSQCIHKMSEFKPPFENSELRVGTTTGTNTCPKVDFFCFSVQRSNDFVYLKKSDILV